MSKMICPYFITVRGDCMDNQVSKNIVQINKETKNKSTYTDDEITAALLLIKHLYKAGKIKEHVYKNILKDYKDRIDISEF